MSKQITIEEKWKADSSIIKISKPKPVDNPLEPEAEMT